MSLDDYSVVQLLAEVDRRTRAAELPTVYFYGVWPGARAGHHIRDSLGQMRRDTGWAHARSAGNYPWLTRGVQPAAQEEGKLWHWHDPNLPITLLTCWDRSEDQRHGCCASFIVLAHVTPTEGLRLARETYASVFTRIEKHLGCALQLSGPVPT